MRGKMIFDEVNLDTKIVTAREYDGPQYSPLGMVKFTHGHMNRDDFG